MKVSVNWLHRFVEFDESPEQIADLLIRLAFDLEEMIPVRRHLRGIVAGKILEVRPHPQAEKLVMCTVDVGGERLEIACGAPNCRPGVIAPVAKPGTRVGEMKVERREIRGVASEGILLSERELGITDDHSGILELGEETAPGASLETLVEPEDTVLDFEVTVNRPDAMSHLGIARELAAGLGRPLHLPEIDLREAERPVSDRARVTIEAPEQGPRYVARVVEGLTVGPAPLAMRAMLHALGQRPINNVVDITNYVLFELGHPLHAFDYHLIADGHVIVRLAGRGEVLRTLDGQERVLEAEDLLIADPEKAVALAGVMGGENSEVVESTRDVLIEAAYFDPVTIRRTSKRLGLTSEASRRFERGADPEMPPLAAARCAQLLRDAAGGEILRGDVDVYPNPLRPRPVMVRPSRAAAVLGIDITPSTAASALEAFQLKIEERGEDQLVVGIPSFRMHDLLREIDLIEEIARQIGYDTVPDATRSMVPLRTPDRPFEAMVDAATDVLAGLGFREAVTNSMVPPQDQAAFHPGIVPHVIVRPISPEMGTYRASLVPGLLRVLEHNLNRGFENVRLFEIGQVAGRGWFSRRVESRWHLAVVAVGGATPPAYDRPAQPFDFYDLKGVIHTLATGLSLDNSPAFSYDVPEILERGLALTGGFGQEEGEEPVLVGGLLDRKVAGHFDLPYPVFLFEVDLERWVKTEEGGARRPGQAKEYRTFSRFPVVVRDLALIVPDSVPAENVERSIRSGAGELLEDVTLFDLYRGKPLGEGERSLAYRLVFRAPDRTLRDDEVDPRVEAALRAAKTLPGVRLRS